MIHRNLSPSNRHLPASLAGGLCVALAVALLLLVAGPILGALRSFRLSQTAMLDDSPTAIRAYVSALDERNEPVFYLDGMTVTASLGEHELALNNLRSFEASDEGVAYIFLVDISRSLSVNEFSLIQAALENWMASLRERDRAAVLAFGDESRLVVDFTNDAELLRESVSALGPTDNSTVFFEALQNGFELARRRDPDLPGRRALIVLTDGRDEGSGWSLEDVLATLKEDPTPIYAIGLSRLRDPQERQQFLQLLRRLATNSGGAFFEGSTDNLTASYAAIREAVHNVWVLDFVCPECNRDGESYRLQLNLSDGERVLSDGLKLRLLPPAAAPATGGELAPGAGIGEESPAADSPQRAGSTTDSVPDGDSSNGWGWLWWGLPLAAAAAGGWLVWNRKHSKPIAPTIGLDSPPEIGPVESESYTTPTGVVTSRPPRPIKLRVVRLVVVRGKQPGRSYNITLLEKALIGSRSTCDCVLIDEPGTSPEQFQLYQMDGHVFIKNLSNENPTLVDGLPTEPQQRLQSESLVGTREFIVRIIFGEGRATARG